MLDPDGSSLFVGTVLAVQAADTSELLVLTGLSLLFLAFCVFFTLCETALEEYGETKLQKMADDGNRNAKLFLKMAENYGSLSGRIRIGFVLSAMICEGAALLGPGIQLAVLWQDISWMGPVRAPVLAFLLVAFASAVLLLMLGYLLPRYFAWQNPDRVAVATASFLRVLLGIFGPVSALCQLLTNGILRLFKIDPNKDPEEGTEEDILEMVDTGGEKGLIPHSEREMINNIFLFDDRTAADVMTHRTEIEAVEAGDDIDEALKVAIEKGFSRIPVYEDTLDNIIGVLYAKDLLMLIGQGKEQQNRGIRDLMRPALYVPESTNCHDLFREFQHKKVQIAVVVDEHGGTSGMVTMEDLLETIVGEIQDEYDEEEDEIIPITDTVFLVDGSTDLEDVQKVLPLQIPPEDNYDTIGGFLTDALGRIPADGEHPSITLSGIVFTVMEMDERRISRVKAEILPVEINE